MQQGIPPLPVSIDCAGILDRLSIALALVHEATGRFTLVNQAFTASFGPVSETFPAWWATIHRDTEAVDVLCGDWTERLAKGGQENIESDMHGMDGHLHHIRTQIQSHAGHLLLCFVDLTDNDNRQDLLRQALAEMETRSTTDPLTGLLTRRRLEEA